MNNLIKVKVKDIWSPIYGDKKPNFKSWLYGWGSLKKSIVNNGYKPEDFTYMDVYKNLKSEDTKPRYTLTNGNHRLKILEELYGLDFEVTVRLRPNPESVTKGLYDRLVRPIISTKTINNIINVSLLLIVSWYFFVVNFLPTIVCGISLWFTIKYFPETNYDKRLHYEPNEDKQKWADKYPLIYTMMLNMNKNLRIILVGLFLTTYLIYLAANSFLHLCVTLVLLAIFLRLKENIVKGVYKDEE